MNFITSKEINDIKSIKDRIDTSDLINYIKKGTIDFFPIKFDDKNINNNYKVFIYGNILGGLPICLIVNNIDIPIYVKADDVEKIKDILSNAKVEIKHIKLIKSTKLKGFNEPHDFVEIGFYGTKYRCIVINLLTNTHNIKVYDNEKSLLYRNFLARYSLKACEWFVCKNVKFSTHKEYYNGILLEVNANNLSNKDESEKLKNKELYYSKAQRKLSWDIETRTYGVNTEGKGNSIDFKAINPKKGVYNEIFMISMSFKWDNGDYIDNFILTTYDQTPSDNFITIKCTDQFDLIKCMFILIKKLRPNIMFDFNGLNFDWKMVIERIKYKGRPKFEKEIEKMMSLCNRTIGSFETKPGAKTNVRIKIDAENSIEGYNYTFLDCICVDLLPTLKKEIEYIAGEKSNINSLNKFLADNGLESKKDLNYNVMYQYCDSGDLDKMLIVAEYCLRDSIALFDLEEKRKILGSYDQMANFTYVGKYESFNNANGIKITYAMKRECYAKNILMTKEPYVYNSGGFEGKFGGLVLDSNKGLHAYNIFDYKKGKYSEDLNSEIENKNTDFRINCSERNKEYIEAIQSDTIKDYLYDFEKRYPPKINTEWVADRPSIADDYASLYPSVIMNENFSPEMKINASKEKLLEKLRKKGFILKYGEYGGEKAYIIQHEGNPDKMGVLPALLFRLYNERVKIKEEVKKCYTIGDTFTAGVLTCKEKGIKLILNSSYGFLGDKNNSYFKDNYLFQGTCNVARKCLLIAKMIVEYRGCVVNYGDTDSIYYSPPEDIFLKIDEDYNNDIIDSKEYLKQQVNASIKYGWEMTSLINKILMEEGNTHFKIALEECLSNACFIGKKAYFGYDNGSKEFNDNYYDCNLEQFCRNVLQRGIATRKREKSDFIRLMIKKLMMNSSIHGLNKSLVEVICELIGNIYTGELEEKIFSQYSTYRSGCQNTKLNVFVERMKEYGIYIENLEKFRYYICTISGGNFDIKGKRFVNLGKRMYHYSLLKEKEKYGIDIDKEYYISSFITNIQSYLSYRFERREDAGRYLTRKLIKNENSKEENKRNKEIYNILHKKSVYGGYVHDELLRAIRSNDDLLMFVREEVCNKLTDLFTYKTDSCEVEFIGLEIRFKKKGNLMTSIFNELKRQREDTAKILYKNPYKRKSFLLKLLDKYKYDLNSLFMECNDNFHTLYDEIKDYNNKLNEKTLELRKNKDIDVNKIETLILEKSETIQIYDYLLKTITFICMNILILNDIVS